MRLNAGLLLALWATSALAEGKLPDVKKGKELYASCQASATDPQKTYLAGYVTGSADASIGKYLCPKEPLSTQQLVDEFCRYLTAHSKNHNRPGGLLLGLSFAEAWPCS